MVAPVSVNWRGVTLCERAAAMMDEVARLSGDVYVRPTQGSYSGGGVQASAGTHDGCCAIDIAGQDEGMTQADREVICNAGRQVGFAMWIRTPDQSDWPFHIHGIGVQPGGQWDTGGLSDGGHGQVIDYYEGRNGLASGAPDDGPRDWVGATWETYKPEDDMTPEQANQLANVQTVVNWINAWKDQINPREIHETFERAGWINEWKDGIDPVIRLTGEQVSSLVAGA